MTRWFCGLWTVSYDASGQTNCKAVKQNFLPPSSAVLRCPWTQVLKPAVNAPEGKLLGSVDASSWTHSHRSVYFRYVLLSVSAKRMTAASIQQWPLRLWKSALGLSEVSHLSLSVAFGTSRSQTLLQALSNASIFIFVLFLISFLIEG